MLRPRENSTRSPNVLAKSGVAKGEEGVRSIDRRWRISTAGKSINLNLLEKHMRPEIYDAFWDKRTTDSETPSTQMIRGYTKDPWENDLIYEYEFSQESPSSSPSKW